MKQMTLMLVHGYTAAEWSRSRVAICRYDFRRMPKDRRPDHETMQRCRRDRRRKVKA